MKKVYRRFQYLAAYYGMCVPVFAMCLLNVSWLPVSRRNLDPEPRAINTMILGPKRATTTFHDRKDYYIIQKVGNALGLFFRGCSINLCSSWVGYLRSSLYQLSILHRTFHQAHQTEHRSPVLAFYSSICGEV